LFQTTWATAVWVEDSSHDSCVLQEPAIIALASGTFINNNGSAASLTAPSGAMYQEPALSSVGKTLNPQQFAKNTLEKGTSKRHFQNVHTSEIEF
jgi:hypothetical protein